MSNKAKNSKESILCDAKELMKLYDRVTWHLPKARREHSAVRRFEDAGYAIIHYCTIAMELKGENMWSILSGRLAKCWQPSTSSWT